VKPTVHDSWLQQGYSQCFNEPHGHRLGSRRLKLLLEDNKKFYVPKLHLKFARMPESPVSPIALVRSWTE
jgi:hypothetical protein